eukprot:gene9211-237_t
MAHLSAPSYIPPHPPAEQYQQMITDLGSFHTVQGFWAYWGNLHVDHLKNNLSLRLFQRGMLPTWEDPNNLRGGRWVCRGVPPEESCFILLNAAVPANLGQLEAMATLLIPSCGSLADPLAAPCSHAALLCCQPSPWPQTRQRYWSELVLLLIGENLEQGPEGVSVNGAVLSTKKSGDVLQVWVKGRDDGGGTEMKEFLQEQACHAGASSNVLVSVGSLSAKSLEFQYTPHFTQDKLEAATRASINLSKAPGTGSPRSSGNWSPTPEPSASASAAGQVVSPTAAMGPSVVGGLIGNNIDDWAATGRSYESGKTNASGQSSPGVFSAPLLGRKPSGGLVEPNELPDNVTPSLQQIHGDADNHPSGGISCFTCFAIAITGIASMHVPLAGGGVQLVPVSVPGQAVSIVSAGTSVEVTTDAATSAVGVPSYGSQAGSQVGSQVTAGGSESGYTLTYAASVGGDQAPMLLNMHALSMTGTQLVNGQAVPYHGNYQYVYQGPRVPSATDAKKKKKKKKKKDEKPPPDPDAPRPMHNPKERIAQLQHKLEHGEHLLSKREARNARRQLQLLLRKEKEAEEAVANGLEPPSHTEDVDSENAD